MLFIVDLCDSPMREINQDRETEKKLGERQTVLECV